MKILIILALIPLATYGLVILGGLVMAAFVGVSVAGEKIAGKVDKTDFLRAKNENEKKDRSFRITRY